MTLSLDRFGLHLKTSLIALLTSLIIYLTPTVLPISKGDVYQRRLSHWRGLVTSGQFSQADKLESRLDQQDILYLAQLYHPRYITDTIRKILKKPTKSTDDLIEISLLYYRMGDTANSRHFLTLAEQNDPIRSDIEKLFHQLF